MATISTSQTFDSAPRTAGEAFTINSGAIFTIDSDTRDGKNSAAARAGSMSSFTMTAASGGKVVIDGSKVKYIKYDGLIGTPNVPAAGTIIAGVTSGAFGELMNISSAISAVPTAAGVAMPATGIIKLKSITGTFQDNEIVEIQGSTDLCLVNGTQRTGWIEVVMDDAATNTVGRAQEWVVNNDNTPYWFESETTGTGAPQQQVQFPNYGGANFFLPGVWVDEAANGTWEFWPATITGTGTFWQTTAMGTDARSKFCQCLGGGIIRFGGDGTTAWGKIPTIGAKFRIPNVLLKSAATASRASDSVPSATTTSRPDFVLTNAGSLRINGAIGHWNIVSSQAYGIRLNSVAFFDIVNISETATSMYINDIGMGNYVIAQDAAQFILANNYAGGTVSKGRFGRSGTIAANDYGVSVTYCNGFTFTDCHFVNRTLRGNAASYPGYFAYCENLTLTDCVSMGSGTYIFTCDKVNVNNFRYADDTKALSSATNTPSGAIMFNNSSNIVVNGGGYHTSVANVHPDSAFIYTNWTRNIKIRNFGTFAAPLSAGTSNAMLYFINDGGNSFNIEVKRCYWDLIATSFITGNNSSKNVEITNFKTNASAYKAIVYGALNLVVKNGDALGTGLGVVPASLASIYGSHFGHVFTSTTAGRVQVIFNEPTAETAPYITTSFTTSATGTSGFNSNGGMALINSGDSATFEFPWKIIGVDNFQNVAPTITTATNISSEYAINTGAGYSAWKTLNAANLFAEVVDEIAGFNLKFRFTATATNAANILTVAYALTSSNATAQALTYPLDTTTLTLTGLSTDSDAVILAAGTETVRGTSENISGTTYNYVYETPETVDIRVYKPGYYPFSIVNYALGSSNANVLVAQVPDASYLE